MNSNENWVLVVRSKVRKLLSKFPVSDQARLIQTIQDLPANPFAGDVEKMAGGEIWRRRVGAYRIFYEIISTQKVIYVFDVKRRTSSTY